jgi:hypothetical protein
MLQDEMFNKAKECYDACLATGATWDGVILALNNTC